MSIHHMLIDLFYDVFTHQYHIKYCDDGKEDASTASKYRGRNKMLKLILNDNKGAAQTTCPETSLRVSLKFVD